MSSSNATDVAKRILDLSEAEDLLGILNLAVPPGSSALTKSSSTADLRKAYLKLSLLIHPDKLGKVFPDATRAFQALVRAFDYVTTADLQVEDEEDEKSGRGKGKGGKSGAKDQKPQKISRSNENCHRTRILCPRCRQPWNEGTLDGCPDYCYNFLMTGLKRYTCSTCLCEFGCMTAIHLCPFCSYRFEYSPSDYHHMIECRNKKCGKKFGFYLYHISDRALKDMKLQIKQEIEAREKQREAKLRRAARSAARGGLTMQEQEASFMRGLSDICPRCGEDFIECDDQDMIREHLLNCQDEGKHKQFQQKQAKEKEKKAKKAELENKQESVQTEAAWEFLGGKQSQLWLLDEDQLKRQAQRRGLDDSGDKDDLIERLVNLEEKKGSGRRSSHGSASKDVLLIKDDPSNKRKSNKKKRDDNDEDSEEDNARSQALVKRRAISREDLPSNFHSLSVAQLRSICVANGLKALIPSRATKSDLINVLDSQL